MSVIERASQRMMECDKAGEEENTRYWAAYLDGARSQEREDREKYGLDN